MKTTTTTNTRDIMTRAHALTRETLAKYPGASYRATLAAALRLCWATDPVRALEALETVARDPAALEKLAGAMVYKAGMRRAANVAALIRSNGETGHNNASAVPVMASLAGDLADLKQEAICRFLERVARARAAGAAPTFKDGRALSPANLMYWTANAALEKLYRETKKHPSASRTTELDEDETEATRAEIDMSRSRDAQRADYTMNPERVVMIRDRIESAAAGIANDGYRADALRMVWASRVAGYSTREITRGDASAARRARRILAAFDEADEANERDA